LNSEDKPQNQPTGNLSGIRVENVSHYYGRARVLNSINFEAEQGEVCVILGPNGAGKTTLLRLITGYFLPAEGRVWLRDKEMTRKPILAKQSFGYLPEHFPIYPYMTVSEFLLWCLELRQFGGKKKDEVARVISLVGLYDRRNTRIRKLSKGMRQRTSLAQALLGDPPFLILDEPTSGLDPHQIKEMREMIAGFKGKRTVILSTHILAEAAQVADRIIILSEGNIIASGKPRQLAQAYLEGESIYRIGFHGKLEAVENKLKKIQSIIFFELVNKADDDLTMELRVKPRVNGDVVLKQLIQARLRPFEFFRKELKLEDIFMRAVVQEDPV